MEVNKEGEEKRVKITLRISERSIRIHLVYLLNLHTIHRILCMYMSTCNSNDAIPSELTKSTD